MGGAVGAIADADLFLVDDGAGGTNRKATADQLVDYILKSGKNATDLASVKVAGITTVGGAIDANGGINASSVKVEDLTSGRVVLAGTGGELTDSGNLTFASGTLGVTGDATISNDLTVSGNLVI